MKLKILQQVFQGLGNNKVRTLLTTLGIIIGSAMVILVFSAGAGFKSYIEAEIDSYGSNAVFIETRVPPTTQALANGVSESINTSTGTTAVAITSLKTRDVADIKRWPNVADAYGIVIGQKAAAYKGVKKNIMFWGSDPGRFQIDKGELASGRFYTEREELGLSQVAILGYELARDLFGEEDPINKIIRVGDLNFTVVGVYEERGGFGPHSTDNVVFIPLRTAQKKILGIDHLVTVIAQIEESDAAEATVEDIRAILRRNHNIDDPKKDDFLVQTSAQALNTLGAVLAGINFLLIAVAAISLLVGGVGIMNIMYVAVTERIGEIGLKKALGAKRSDILSEFLLEAVLLTLLGGVAGILSGAAMAFLVSKIAASYGLAWDYIVPLYGIIISVSISALIGIVFGVFPARNAAKLDPIQALNKE